MATCTPPTPTKAPPPADPRRLAYRRGTTERHHPKYAECWKGSKPDTFRAECIPSQLKEWQELILPQNGFAPVLEVK